MRARQARPSRASQQYPSLFSSASRSRNRGRSPAPEYTTHSCTEGHAAPSTRRARNHCIGHAVDARIPPQVNKQHGAQEAQVRGQDQDGDEEEGRLSETAEEGRPQEEEGRRLDFEVYADADEGVVTFEGLAQLADDLGIDPSSDTKLLAMCWRLGAEKPGCLSKEEWARFAENRHLPTYGKAQTVSVLKAGWNSLDPNFLDNGEFKPFFRFCFEFNREGTKRFLERDTALALLPLCVEDRSRHTQLFLEFLGTKPEDFKLNRDQWCSFLDFSLAVGEPPEFAGWDAEGSSWPILLDEFVEFTPGEAQGACNLARARRVPASRGSIACAEYLAFIATSLHLGADRERAASRQYGTAPSSTRRWVAEGSADAGVANVARRSRERASTGGEGAVLDAAVGAL